MLRCAKFLHLRAASNFLVTNSLETKGFLAAGMRAL
jgi:hypothetical protein